MSGLASTAVESQSPCRLCGASSAHLLTERGRRGEPLRVLLCTACGLARVDPMPGEASLAAWYGTGYRREYKGVTHPSSARLWRLTGVALERAADLAPRIPQHATTLDVGCGAGELVFLLRALGHEATGFDPDSHYVEWARRTLGPWVSAGSIERFPAAPAAFDAVTMYHVLEHLREPVQTLRRIAAWLRPGGLLLIEVPNLESTVQAPGHQFHKAHLHYFNQATLTAAAAQAGLSFEEGGAFDRGENLRCYFRRNDAVPAELRNSANATHLLAILHGHRTAAHYLCAHPYRRLWNRFRRTLAEAAHGMSYSEQQILKLRTEQLRQRLGSTAGSVRRVASP